MKNCHPDTQSKKCSVKKPFLLLTSTSGIWGKMLFSRWSLKGPFLHLCKKCSTVVYYSLYTTDFFYTILSFFFGLGYCCRPSLRSFSSPSDPASLEMQPILQLAQLGIHPEEPKLTRVSGATSLFLEESLQPLFEFNLLICYFTKLSHAWSKVGHCQLLQSQAWRLSSYTYFPSGFSTNFSGTWKGIHLCESRDSRMGLDTAQSQLGHSCVTEGSLLSTATTEVTCWEFCL